VIKKQAIEKNRTVRAGENGNLQIHVDLQDFGVGCAKEFIALLDPPRMPSPLKPLLPIP
jgi:hypothetical protein